MRSLWPSAIGLGRRRCRQLTQRDGGRRVRVRRRRLTLLRATRALRDHRARGGAHRDRRRGPSVRAGGRSTWQARQCCSSPRACGGRISTGCFASESALSRKLRAWIEAAGTRCLLIGSLPDRGRRDLVRGSAPKSYWRTPTLRWDDALRWAFVGGLMLFLASESIMARRLTGSLTWERHSSGSWVSPAWRSGI